MTAKPGQTHIAAILAWSWVLLAALPLLALVVRSGPLETVCEIAALVGKTRKELLFGLAQAGGSLAVALLVGLPGAWLVSRFRFPGRRLLRALSVVPFCMPPILVALGFVLYYGKNGYLNRLAMFLFRLDQPPIDILYSFFGLCLVHGFYNFPLILDMVGSSWEGIPSARSEAARSLGAGRVRAFIAGTLPSLAPAIAESSSLAFLFSFFSFIVVMIFGPLGASTPETEIFRLLRFSGDLPSASVLAIAQSLIALACISIFFAASRAVSTRSSDSREVEPPGRPGIKARIAIAFYAFILAVFFLAPLVSL
ncbi:MAG: ABC transporter permease subunit, partial [Spirochaetota bacterium]